MAKPSCAAAERPSRTLVLCLFANRHFPPGKADPGEDGRLKTKGLVHIGYDFDHLADEITIRVFHGFSNKEDGSKRQPPRGQKEVRFGSYKGIPLGAPSLPWQVGESPRRAPHVKLVIPGLRTRVLQNAMAPGRCRSYRLRLKPAMGHFRRSGLHLRGSLPNSGLGTPIPLGAVERSL
jgi:hypothetical protein